MSNPGTRYAPIPDPEHRKNMFMEIRDGNKSLLTIAQIAIVSGISAKSVESFLYDENRFPSMFTLYACIKFVRASRGVLSREHHNITRTVEARWNRIGNRVVGKPTIIGDKQRAGGYLFNGERRSLVDISVLSEIKYDTLYQRIKKLGIIEGDDISPAIDYKSQKIARYLSDGEMLSITEIAKKTGIERARIWVCIKKNNIPAGADCAAAVNFCIQTKRRKK